MKKFKYPVIGVNNYLMEGTHFFKSFSDKLHNSHCIYLIPSNTSLCTPKVKKAKHLAYSGPQNKSGVLVKFFKKYFRNFS